jgi:lipoate-protein ligase B
MRIIDLGLKEYREVWEFQKDIVKRRARGEIENTLIITEHFPVFTIGAKKNTSNLLVSYDFLKRKGIPLYFIERGGDITYHGPGQLIAYPILKLENIFKSIKKLVNDLEQVVIEVLKEFGINGERWNKERGVFVSNKKIASIGIAVKNRVSFHGLAFNINMDLEPFNWINPCGLKISMTDLSKERGENIRIEDVKPVFIKKFIKIFKN